MTKSLSSIIHEMDDGKPVMLITERVVDLVLTEHRGIAEKMLTPLVRDEIRRRRQQASRAAEDEAFDHGHTGRETQSSVAMDVPESPLEALRAVARNTFWCPKDRARVHWGEATIEQHASRANWQRERSATLTEDAERHEAAIAVITGSPGATCLNDVLAEVAA